MLLTTSKKIPDCIDLNAKKADSINFLVYEKFFPHAFRAVKNSEVLPPELIDYLTEDETFEGVLSKAGFGIEGFIDSDPYSRLPALGLLGFTSEKAGRLLKCSSYQEVLGEYTRKFMFAIPRFIKEGSYIEFLCPYTGNYPQGEGYKYRWEFDCFQPDVRIYY